MRRLLQFASTHELVLPQVANAPRIASPGRVSILRVASECQAETLDTLDTSDTRGDRRRLSTVYTRLINATKSPRVSSSSASKRRMTSSRLAGRRISGGAGQA